MAASDNEEQDEVEEENVKEKSKRKRKRKRKKHGVKGDEDDVDEARNIDLEEKLHSLDHTIYVEGLPFDATEEEVREFFVSGGCTDIVQLRLPRWQDSGRLRGYGHVVFDSRESRQKAIAELNRKNLGARYVSIQAPKEPRGGASASVRTINTPREPPEGCCVVFIKNLPYHATEEDIQHEFETCGKIVEGGVRIARNSQTRQSKGFCYVEFKNPEGAQGAVEKAAKPFGMKVLDRPVFVDYDEGRMKGSFKTEDGRLWSKEFGKKS
jgi:nucleolin